MTIQTAGTGSGTGISDATNGTIDIGASDAYLSPSGRHGHPDLKNIPLAISAQLVAYNVPGVTAAPEAERQGALGDLPGQDHQVERTRRSPVLNPGVTLPSHPDRDPAPLRQQRRHVPVHARYLSKTDPSGWGTKIGYNTTVPWPNAPGALGETGNSGMVSGCKATPGCIAYIGISYLTQALQAGLGYAAAAERQGPVRAAQRRRPSRPRRRPSSKKTPANGTISLIYGPANGGYPIVNYEYAIVSTRPAVSSSTAKNIRSVLEWAVNPKDGNSPSYLRQVNFQPLPAKVEAQSIKQILSIK